MQINTWGLKIHLTFDLRVAYKELVYNDTAKNSSTKITSNRLYIDR